MRKLIKTRRDLSVWIMTSYWLRSLILFYSNILIFELVEMKIMTELEKRAYEIYPDYTDEEIGDLGRRDYLNRQQKAFREAYIKGANEGAQETVQDYDDLMNEAYYKGRNETLKSISLSFHGWIARDKRADPFWGNGLIFHYSKPKRTGDEWSSETIALHLPDDSFPEITWESEPIEVELIIRKS